MVILDTNYGRITLQLEPAKAPKTVANFLKYVGEGYFDGTIFHRVIDNFMIQGGGFVSGMRQKATHGNITNEAANGLRNVRGSIAMARTPDPHSASSQFFINVADNDFLNHTSPTPDGWGYCVFGRVIDGMEVVDRIKGVATTTRGGHQNVPVADIVIDHATVQDDE
ncbi:MAG TPA: peptidylprolyl isomerase [Acidiferrobacteraceae bacterium]|nr:peptidylprolyl isomerase [Acidiferrobacteraceae bacterium]